jgi:trimethylamine monooxygenase
VRDLIEATDYPMFDLDEVVEIFLEWKHDKAEDIMGYRDRAYRSVMTGTIASTHHTKWVDELDDSLARYLAPLPAACSASGSAAGAAADPAADAAGAPAL